MPFIDSRFINPSVHLFSKCPNCEKLLPVKLSGEEYYIEEKVCQNCGFEFDSYELLQNLVKNTIVTQAVSSASSILGLDLAVIIFVLASIIVFFLLPSFFLVLYFLFTTTTYSIPIFICVRWLFKFGRWKIIDEEFIEAKKNVKSSLIFWIVTHIFVVAIFLYKFWV